MVSLAGEVFSVITVMVSIEASPGDKLVSEPGDPIIVGYFQTLGVTAKNRAELESIVRQHVRDDLGGELIGIDEEWPPDFDGDDCDIKDQVDDINSVGIWFRSGRAFYGPED